jgi:adenosylcobinamide hydrolase
VRVLRDQAFWAALPAPELAYRGPEDEQISSWPVHVWRLPRPVRLISSGPLGGGIGQRQWVLNATVHRDYARLDPEAHLDEIASALGLTGPGVGLLTAVDVRDAVTAEDCGVRVVATVGLGHPTLAAAPPDVPEQARVAGTINIVAFLPGQLADAALVNAVATATEAKVQALHEHGMSATGTATDAVVIGCLGGPPEVEPYGGPRSVWGARLARAVHAAVRAGARQWSARMR